MVKCSFIGHCFDSIGFSFFRVAWDIIEVFTVQLSSDRDGVFIIAFIFSLLRILNPYTIDFFYQMIPSYSF